MVRTIRLALLVVAIGFTSVAGICAEDWPTHRRDNGRSGVSHEKVDFAAFNQTWVWKSSHPPQVAWPGPAKWDAYANIFSLPNMRDYDHCFGAIHVGDSIWFGSSADDTLYCLAASTGKEKWTFTANGPIRMAPTFFNDHIYFGCDDGAAYCLSAATGELKWKFVAPTDRPPIINNGRLISPLPCRTGVVVQDGLAMFGFGLLPWQDSHLVAVNAKTGETTGGFNQKFAGETFEGPMATVGDVVVACRGRVPPKVFNRKTGAAQRSLATGGGGAGGSFLASTPAGELLHGPSNKQATVVLTNPTAGKPTASYKASRCAVAIESGLILAGDVGVKFVDHEQRTVWKQLTTPSYEVIVVGDAVVVGAENEVRAFNLKDGKPVWRRRVQGVARGLTFANGRLTVSTDAGYVYSFAKGGLAPEQSPETVATKPPEKSKTPTDEPTRGLLSHWVFELGMEDRARRRGLANAESFVGDRMRNNDARMTRPLSIQEAGAAQALVFDGQGSVLVSDDRKAMNLPAKEFTVSAWVRVDQTTKWGAFIGFIQDNGPFERGWLLGLQDDHFSFAVKSKESNALTYLQSKKSFEKRRWYHVAGVYDGAVQRIYVNGELAGEAKTQAGDIDYPTEGYFEIGAYHDVNENYPLTGQIHAIALHNAALSPKEVTAAYRAKVNWFPQPITLAAGPWWRFERGGKATVQWRTAKPSPTLIKTTIGEVEAAAEHSKPKIEHRVTLTNLPRQSVGALTIETLIEGKRGATPAFDLDTHFDRSVPRSTWVDNGSATRTTRHLLSKFEGSRGLAVVVGANNLSVAKSLIDESEFRVLLLIETEKQVAYLRNVWFRREYGVRIAVRMMPDDLRKSLPNQCFNLVVGSTDLSDTNLAIPNRGVYAVVENGEWGIKRATAKEGTGEWTHQYGMPSNSAFGGESLGGVSRADDLQVRWIGRPGPRMQPDRSGRKPSPLAAGGRLYVQGMHRICAVDAANGTMLWGLEIPALERFNIPRDSGNWCCDDDFLYAAIGSHVWKIQGETGEIVEMLPLVLKDQSPENWDWSYLARTTDQQKKSHLIGSAVKKGTAYTNFWGGAAAGWYDAVSGPATFKICSENLFSLDPKTGKTNWEYSGGLIVNPTITIHNGRAYFVEARYPSLKKETTRRLGGDDFWKDQYLVSLDLATGKVEWEKKLVIDRGVAVFYLAAAKENLVITTSNNKQYAVYGYNTKNGEETWSQQFGWPRGAGDHGKAMSRPAIVGGKLYVRPQAMDLATGAVLKESVPLGGCGTYAATENALIFRQSSITMWSPEANTVTKWSRLRPGCWLSTVPACGMVLSPEAGGGCSCGNWLEASIGFAPR